MSHAQHDPTPPAQRPWPAQAPVQGRGASRLLPVLGFAFGLLGLVAGVGAWFRAAPTGPPPPVYSEQQVADAKEAVCEAYAKGVRSFQIAGNRQIANPTEALPVAVNTRLAEVAVGNYLINAIDENPAAPAELQKSITVLAQSYQDIALEQLAESSDYKQAGLNADEAISKIDKVCA
jgi:hypothetical protein